MNPVLYALGTFVSEAPWLILATVPFWGKERMKKKWIVLILLAVTLLRTAAGYGIAAWFPGGLALLDYSFILQPLLLLAVYSICYKVHIMKLLYTTLLTVSISIPVSMLSALISLPFVALSPEMDVIMEASPAWILAAALLTAMIIPLVYWLFRKILRAALSGFTVKTVRYLCAAPALFFLFYAYSIFAVPYFNWIYLFTTPVAGVFCAYINLRMILNLQELAQYKSDMRIQEMKNEYLLENYQALENHYKQISEMKHEMHHHLLVVRTLLAGGEYEQLGTYLSDIDEHFSEILDPILCENRVIQAVLGHAARRAREMGFQIQFDVLPLPDLRIPDSDFVSLFMNLLENALESCEKIPEDKDRRIQVKLKTRLSYLCLSISNARCGELIIKDGFYASTKGASSLHGHGISVVKKIVDKHHGLISFEHTDDMFFVDIALPVI